MAALTPEQVYALARNAGATREEAIILTAIAKGESGWDSGKRYNPANTTEDSYGLWQINMDPKYGASRRKTFGIDSNEKLYDPIINARAALSILRSQGWGAWTIYKNGAYKKYLPAAEAAAARVPDADIQKIAVQGRVVGVTQQTIGGATAGNLGTLGGADGMGGTAATVGSPGTLPPNASPAQIEQYIRDNYPQAAGYLDIPEIRGKLIQAAQEGWTPTKLQAEIQGTVWWRTTGADARQYIALANTDPETLKRMVDAKEAELRPLIATLGIDTDVHALAADAVKFGRSTDEIRQNLAGWLTAQSSQSGLTQGSSVDVTADELMRIARNEYLLPMSRQDLEKWAIGIFQGTKTEEEFRDFMGRLTAGRFPGLTEQGITPGEYFAPIRNIVAQTLELQPGDVDLLNNQYSALLESSDGKGGFRPMTISEAQQWARSLPRYRVTKGAMDTASTLGEQIAQRFGAVA